MNKTRSPQLILWEAITEELINLQHVYQFPIWNKENSYVQSKLTWPSMASKRKRSQDNETEKISGRKANLVSRVFPLETRLREPQYCTYIVNIKSDTAVRNTRTMNITKNYPCNTLISGQHKNPFDQKAELAWELVLLTKIVRGTTHDLWGWSPPKY